MDLSVNIDPEAINKEIVEAVSKSAIGDALSKTIKEEVEKMKNSYSSPYAGIISSEIKILVQKIIRDEYKDALEQFVRTNISQEFTDKLLNKLWDKFEDDFY